jgi:hypothetical protein
MQVRGRLLLVGDTGFEPVTSSVSGKRATAAPIARVLIRLMLVGLSIRVERVLVEVEKGFEPS